MKPYQNFSFKNLKGETWMPLIRYNSHYSVSNLGRVKVESRIIDGRNCKAKIKKGRLDQHGYVHTTLIKNGKQKIEKHHRLVAEAFILNPENKPFINHINGVRDDNRLENLEWCTAKENIQHSIKIGSFKILQGEDTSMSKLTNQESLCIYNSSEKASILAKKYKVSVGTIYGIRNGLYYSEITGKKHEKKDFKTGSKVVEWEGERMNHKQIADKLGANPVAIYYRFKNGWTIDRIMNTPVKKYNYSNK